MAGGVSNGPARPLTNFSRLVAWAPDGAALSWPAGRIAHAPARAPSGHHSRHRSLARRSRARRSDRPADTDARVRPGRDRGRAPASRGQGRAARGARRARDGGAPVGPRLGVGAQIAAPARRTRERVGAEGDAEAGGWRGRGGARARPLLGRRLPGAALERDARRLEPPRRAGQRRRQPRAGAPRRRGPRRPHRGLGFPERVQAAAPQPARRAAGPRGRGLERPVVPVRARGHRGSSRGRSRRPLPRSRRASRRDCLRGGVEPGGGERRLSERRRGRARPRPGRRRARDRARPRRPPVARATSAT